MVFEQVAFTLQAYRVLPKAFVDGFILPLIEFLTDYEGIEYHLDMWTDGIRLNLKRQWIGKRITISPDLDRVHFKDQGDAIGFAFAGPLPEDVPDEEIHRLIPILIASFMISNYEDWRRGEPNQPGYHWLIPKFEGKMPVYPNIFERMLDE